MPFNSFGDGGKNSKARCNRLVLQRQESSNLELWEIGQSLQLDSPLNGQLLGTIKLIQVGNDFIVVETAEGDIVESITVQEGYRFASYELDSVYLHYVIGEISDGTVVVIKSNRREINLFEES